MLRLVNDFGYVEDPRHAAAPQNHTVILFVLSVPTQRLSFIPLKMACPPGIPNRELSHVFWNRRELKCARVNAGM